MHSRIKLAEQHDKQQAFAIGFALAARDAGLDSDEYFEMCKIAAQAAQPAPAVQPVAPQTDKQTDMANRQAFVQQKAQQLTAARPAPAAAMNAAPGPALQSAAPAPAQPVAAKTAASSLEENMAARSAYVRSPEGQKQLAAQYADVVAKMRAQQAAKLREEDASRLVSAANAGMRKNSAAEFYPPYPPPLTVDYSPPYPPPLPPEPARTVYTPAPRTKYPVLRTPKQPRRQAGSPGSLSPGLYRWLMGGFK